MPNELFVQTDKGEYYEGDTIYGTVLVCISQPIEAKSLSLEVKGEEKVFWQYEYTEWETAPDGTRQSRTVVREHEGKRSFFEDSFRLIDYPGGFPTGMFSYPFQYTLPHQLPGVFRKMKDHPLAFKAKIVYKIKAIVDIPHTSHDLKVKVPLTIHERLEKNLEPKHEIKSREVLTCCCIPRGPVNCEVWMDKNAYCMGETARVYVSVRNDSKVNVNHFNTKLIRTISLNDGHGHTTQRRDIVCMAKYDGTVAMSTKETEVPLTLLSKKGRDIKPSTHGSLIQCEYSLMIEMDIPMAPDLEIYSPIQIYTPVSFYWSNWQPPVWISQAQPQMITCQQLLVPQEIIQQRMQNGYIV